MAAAGDGEWVEHGWREELGQEGWTGRALPCHILNSVLDKTECLKSMMAK